MREGSVDAPVRHALDWQNPDFYNEEMLDEELRRVFDICHGCRRCFNLCSSFPTLFDLIDEAETGELDSVESKDFKPVIDDCTLCDMCFMTKCPYVPPHEFNLDFPHLILRARAVENKKKQVDIRQKQLAKTDRNGALGTKISPVVNWASNKGNAVTRPVLEKMGGVSASAELPKYMNKTLQRQAGETNFEINEKAPAFGKKLALFVGCHCNYSDGKIGMASLELLAKFGVKAEVVYPECCGMPQLEHGSLQEVSEKATRLADAFKPYIDDGYDVACLTPSCSFLMKFEYPLILPHNENVKKLSAATYDISEYIMYLAKEDGLPEQDILALDGAVSVHIACHARAQNMGQKAAELMRLIPDIDLNVVERCSGHGGSWGVMKAHFDTAVKVGRPAAKKMQNNDKAKYIVSECPLAAMHLGQIIEDDKGKKGEGGALPETVPHPVILLAKAYGIDV